MGYKQTAWIVRWNWVGDHAACKRPVVAILRPRLHDRIIKEIVQAMYVSHAYSLEEQARFSKCPRDNPYQPESSSGRITCGHNPFLEAFKVRELHFSTDRETGEESFTFRYFDRYDRNPETGEGLLVPGKTDTITQPALNGDCGFT